MFDIMIQSRLKEYGVNFVEDFTIPLKKATDEGAFIICDKAVFDTYNDRILGSINPERSLVMEASEEAKTLRKCEEIITVLVEQKVRRNQKLIALGGGVVQDVTAFIASLLYRGVDWIFFPTTLLAQADSCIGSKTSINFGGYKNLLGGFYPPSHIYIDLGFLETLPNSEIKSGIGEILHFYLIDDSKLSKPLMDRYDEFIETPKKLKEYILESLKIKKNVIEVDEFDKNQRNLFNYGHTFGHAIETVTGYEINHGQAVTMGMDIANFVSLKLGYLSDERFKGMQEVLSRNIPSFSLEDHMTENYFEALSKDKKNTAGHLGCILTSGPGFMEKVQIPFDDKFKQIILSYFELAR
jgi:3-dehydroquinate synthase